MKKIKWCPRTYIISVGGRQAIWVFEGIAIGGMMGYCMKRMIEKTKLIQIRGSCIMDFVWDVIHIILFAMTCIYMVLSMCFG